MGISLGVIGTGRIASRAVTEIKEVEGLDIAAVVNPNGEHAHEFGKDHGISACFTDTDQLEGRVDAAYVASPHGTHYGYTKNLLNKGIHVICEKPMAFSKEQAEELFGIAAKRNLILMEGIKTAYCPGFKKIEEIIKSGVIGDVVDVEAAFTRLTGRGCREYDDKKYGGAFTEFGTYTLLPILRFLGTDHYKFSFLSRYTEGIDGYTKAVFNFGDAFGSVKTGLDVKSEGQLLLSGTQGYLLAPSPWWLTKYFEVRHEDPKQIEKYECEFKGDGLRYEFGEFVRRINEGTGISEVEKSEAIARAGIYETFLKDRETGDNV